MSASSFLWYDFETFGQHPRQDKPSQFAALRTDAELNIIGEPMNWLCQPLPDLVPSPDACLITGLTPQYCQEHGMPEPEFAQRILHAMSQPNTCSAGFNSIRFDDEVSRFLFYRNLLPVYDREWRQGNSRWDLLDVVRFTYALRPDGINWPRKEDGSPSFRLEELSQANGLEHTQAHDALSDVRATIGMAQLIKRTQPKLFSWALQCRDKTFVKSQIPVLRHQPFVHVSGMIPASQGCITVLVPLDFHPTNKNEILCFDLRSDPAELAELSADEMRYRLYTPSAELGETPRLAIKSVHVNKCPMAGPISLFTDEVAARHGIDRRVFERHLANLPPLATVLPNLHTAMHREHQPADAEQALYDGFINDRDRDMAGAVYGTPAAEWPHLPMPKDQRLQALVQRFVARHRGDVLPKLPDNWQRTWEQYLSAALTQTDVGSALNIEGARQRVRALQSEHPENAVLQAVDDFLTEQEARLTALTRGV
ncbi:exodeoxyribonuclease I [Salinispirillum marinum]|uniref:Exodeoxyribonuclease I n=2 Tax=Saccharospirillaceae TaxID=255527 RepID=A0ABV8BA13_9GAMM